jgi:hypothetical protein
MAAAAVGAGVVVAPPPRALAAQVSFNHEKRQGWERPVLEAINSQRAGQGLAPVEKLTIQVSASRVCVVECAVGAQPGSPRAAHTLCHPLMLLLPCASCMPATAAEGAHGWPAG